jgi:hypothetical protein
MMDDATNDPAAMPADEAVVEATPADEAAVTPEETQA